MDFDSQAGGSSSRQDPEGPEPGGPEVEDQAQRLVREAEPNLARQPARGDGRSRTLERGRVYLDRLYAYANPEAARAWLDRGGGSDPAPGLLLEAVAPVAFAALVTAVRGHLGRLRDPAAYVRSALADAWGDVLGRLADAARAGPASVRVERGYAPTSQALACGFVRAPGRAVAAPPWIRAAGRS